MRSSRGRRRPIPDINSGVLQMRNYAERAAINSVVQGSAADMIKQAMLNVYDRIRRESRPSRMLLQVHDELVFEVPKQEVARTSEMVKVAMESAAKLDGPLIVESGTGANWMDAKPGSSVEAGAPPE